MKLTLTTALVACYFVLSTSMHAMEQKLKKTIFTQADSESYEEIVSALADGNIAEAEKKARTIQADILAAMYISFLSKQKTQNDRYLIQNLRSLLFAYYDQDTIDKCFEKIEQSSLMTIAVCSSNIELLKLVLTIANCARLLPRFKDNFWLNNYRLIKLAVKNGNKKMVKILVNFDLYSTTVRYALERSNHLIEMLSLAIQQKHISLIEFLVTFFARQSQPLSKISELPELSDNPDMLKFILEVFALKAKTGIQQFYCRVLPLKKIVAQSLIKQSTDFTRINIVAELKEYVEQEKLILVNELAKAYKNRDGLACAYLVSRGANVNILNKYGLSYRETFEREYNQ